VLDVQTRLPISNVLCYNNSLTKATFHLETDSKGQVNLPDGITPDESIIFSRIGYESAYLAYSNIPDTLFLIVSPVNTTEAIIQTEGLHSGTTQKESFTLTEADQNNFRTVGDFLSAKSLLNIRDLGGVGLKTASSRGLPGETTIVLFNGVRVNDLRTGMFDFSSIASQSVDHIMVEQSGVSGANQTAGSLISLSLGGRVDQAHSSLSYIISPGLFQSFSGDYRTPLSSEWSIGAVAERSFGENDFRYSFEGERFKRSNAHHSTTSLSGFADYKGDNTQSNFLISYSDRFNGIPGYVLTNNTSTSLASSSTKLFHFLATTKININEALSINLNSSARNNRFIINDPFGNLLMKSNRSDSQLNDFLAETGFQYKIGNLSISSGYEFTYSELDSIGNFISNNSTLRDINRRTHSLFINPSYAINDIIGVFSQTKLLLGVKLEHLNENVGLDKADYLSARLGLKSALSMFPQLSVTANVFDQRRAPTFNERYYSVIYNHKNLESELYQGFDFGFELNTDFMESEFISVSYYAIDIKNKVLWMPTRFALQTPRNIGKVESRGVGLTGGVALLNKALTYSAVYSFSESIDKSFTSATSTSYGKQLVYTPKHQFKQTLSLTYRGVTFDITSQYASSSYYSSDNDPNYRLESYTTYNIFLAYTRPIFSRDVTIGFSIYNLTDAEYSIIQSYPMPLRMFSFHLTTEIL